MFDKPHPGTATKKCSNCSLKSLEHPRKYIIYAESFYN